jgi:Lrp/AsnC family leucine-responsive transcriptional regulator
LETKVAIDDIGWKILRELQANARISFTELGRRVNLTPPAVADRVRRLEEAGVIAGYRVQLDNERIGLPLVAIIRLRAPGEKCAAFGHEVEGEGYPEILDAHRITGTESYVLKAVLRDVEHLEHLIDRLMPWGETTTSVVLSSPVTHRVIEPEVAQPQVAHAVAAEA